MPAREPRAHRQAEDHDTAPHPPRRRGTSGAHADKGRSAAARSEDDREPVRRRKAGRPEESRSTARRPPDEKTPSTEQDRARTGTDDTGGAPRRRRRAAGIDARQAAAAAARQVQQLTGRNPEGVTSLTRDTDGWRIGIEVLETARIPDSTDILAVYEVTLDQDGELNSYHRERRYYRGRAEEERS